MNRFISVTIFLIAGLVTGCSQRPTGSSPSPDPNAATFEAYDFPSYPDLTHLCNQRVLGAGLEITWDAFASASAPSELVSYYQQRLGGTGFSEEGEGGA